MPPRHGRYYLRHETNVGRVTMHYPTLGVAEAHYEQRRRSPRDNHDAAREYIAGLLADLGEAETADGDYSTAEVLSTWSTTGREPVLVEPPWFAARPPNPDLPLMGKKKPRKARKKNQ